MRLRVQAVQIKWCNKIGDMGELDETILKDEKGGLEFLFVINQWISREWGKCL